MNGELEHMLGRVLLFCAAVAILPAVAVYSIRWWHNFRNWYEGRQRTLKW